MNVTVPIYQRKREGRLHWTTLGLGAFTKQKNGSQLPKLQQKMIEELRKLVETAKPGDLAAFDLKKGTTLRRVRIEIEVDDGGKRRKVSGLIPLILEPRHAGVERVLTIGYHPERQDQWFPVEPTQSLEEQATTWFAKAWAELSVDVMSELWTDGKDLIKVLAFSASPKRLLDIVAGKKKGLWDDLVADPAQKDKPKRQGMKVLPELGHDETARRSAEEEPPGLPRSPWREQLLMLVGGRGGAHDRPGERRSVFVVGKPGVGKSTLVERLIDDLLLQDDYPSHQNLDKVTHVWSIAGKRLIAGMSYVGDWEQRIVDLLEDVRGKKIILYVPDLHAFGRLGQARDSSRSMADVLRGPVARGEVTLLGEATEEQLARLEQDAPAFANLFARVHLREATTDETFKMMLGAARALEVDRNVSFEPMALRTLLELGGSLLSQRALPGSALEMLRQIADEATARATSIQWIQPPQVLKYLSDRTGLPQTLLDPLKPLEREPVARELAQRVIGQDAAVDSATSLVMRIRAGLVDPRRPYGTFLFTGPTGTGKTELSKAIAKYLYGSEDRLLRFDMGEYGAPDAPSRLIGDRWQPEGLLTQSVHEQPFCVVLFDEIEKAHPSVLNLFLQLFDEGRLTDAAGNTASFAHTVVIMTSNLGARREGKVGFGEDTRGVMLDVARAVREFFPPELFNRIDEVVPFSPLTPEVAVEVAQKELGKLLGRRGVSARHIFVQANRAVVEHVAKKAFEQRDGARSLKRFLEDRIGSLVGEEIAKAPDAMLRVMHVFAQQDADAPFRVVQEALVEAKPVDLRSSLEPLLDLPSEAIAPHVHALLPELERLENGQELAALADRIHEALSALARGEPGEADAVYRLDGMRALVRSLRDRVEALLVTSREIEHEALERKRFSHEVLETGSKFAWMRKRLRVLSGTDSAPDPRSKSAAALLGTVAEATFLRRALRAADDPSRHAVALELTPLGPGQPHVRLLGPLSDAYLSWLSPREGHRRGEIDGWALALQNGVVERGTERGTLGPAMGKAINNTGKHVSQLVIRVVGVCVRDLFADEEGTHVLRDGLQAPALVRVRVLPVDPSVTAEGLAREHVARVAAFAASEGETESPTKLLPVVRSITRDARPGGPSPWAIEDYRIAYADTVWARILSEALAPIHLLQLSREDEVTP